MVDGSGRLFFMEDYSDSNSGLEERDLGQDEENEIIDDMVLLTYTNVLQRAQEIAVEE